MDFNWLVISPIIIILGTGVLQVLFEAFVPARARRLTQLVSSLLAVVAALVMTALIDIWGLVDAPTFVAGSDMLGDHVGIFASMALLLIAFLAIMVIADRTSQLDGAFAGQPADRPGSSDESLTNRLNYQRTEFYPLVLFSLGGMLVFVQAASLLTMFVALEVMSLPLYILAASARRQRLISQEAAIKYFILGAFSSAFFLMGTAFLYGALGNINLALIPANRLPEFLGQYGLNVLLLWFVGALLVTVGLLFKVAAAPFHAWTPDVYQGAPTPITGFMAAGVKIAAFVALLRVLATTAVALFPYMQTMIWVIAVLTIVVGTVMGLRQNDIKRMLAYSSIAHAGFLLIAVVGKGTVVTGNVGALLFYLLTYGIATIGAFGIITLVRNRDGEGNITGEATDMSKWAGLGKTNPWLAASMSVLLLSFAGIPLTAGFMAKFWVFASAASQGGTLLVVIAVLASAATAVFYFRLIRTMYFLAPSEKIAVVTSEGLSSFAITVSVLLTVLLGLFPTVVMNLIS
ncbi:NADH-quinone oxidoreductase subunit NuoN [Boudabousia marimammalium]|uniref:NADH-quinone oxidoreductase subunit N n=1 Tax=Boudabousia marimammalium TaxID=156892 RepID=A0A1Q5PMM6_9ACTO|nr:NADH-quinone oxidoreductase subunit NuoN [Boudabousia marimammalium]OKL48773.1 NADH-quinone oxidoreductase subunit N [Boudabousia marimammalium]